MVINPEKIKAVIEYYGKIKDYPKTKHLPMFTADFKLNYNQWASFCNGNQSAGYKVVDIFIQIFPNMDLNYLIKDSIPVDADFFNSSKSEVFVVNEPQEPVKRAITNDQIFTKLEAIHFEIKEGFGKK